MTGRTLTTRLPGLALTRDDLAAIWSVFRSYEAPTLCLNTAHPAPAGARDLHVYRDLDELIAQRGDRLAGLQFEGWNGVSSVQEPCVDGERLSLFLGQPSRSVLQFRRPNKLVAIGPAAVDAANQLKKMLRSRQRDKSRGWLGVAAIAIPALVCWFVAREFLAPVAITTDTALSAFAAAFFSVSFAFFALMLTSALQQNRFDVR